MIKSPLTSPLRPALTSPYELITRSVFELNGTQWGELSEPVVLGVDFEIELPIYCEDSITEPVILLGHPGGSNNCVFLSGEDLTVRDNAGVALYGNGDRISDKSIHTINLIKNGATLSVYSELGLLFSGDIGTLILQKIGARLTNQFPFKGIFFGIKVWTNGDRNTGDLILDVPFDDSGSDYQRNRAVALGGERWSSGNVETVEVPAWTTFSQQTIDSVADKYYQVEIDLDVNSGGIHLVNFSGEPALTESGKYSFVVKSDNTGKLVFQSTGGGFSGSVRNVSVKAWSGVILQNALPEDWTKIEKKDTWDYWLGPELFTQDVWVNPDISDSHWTYISESNQWEYIGDGSLNALQLIPTTAQPDLGILSGTIERTDGVGTFGLCAATVNEYTIDTFHITNPVRFDLTLDNALGSNQQFKRRSGSLSVLLSKPSYRRKLEIAS